MGDRANVVMLQDSRDGKAERGQVWFYSHWGGYRLTGVLQAAMKRGKPRWSDSSYLARIIFCEMVKGSEQELTGFGISDSICDNEHPLLVVDCEKQTVSVSKVEAPLAFSKTVSFEAFVALDAKAIATFRGEEPDEE